MLLVRTLPQIHRRYYVWGIDDLSKPLILTRESQVQDLLCDINKHLKLDLRITSQQREDALVSRFPDHPRCTPRYLGRSQSREDYDTMLENVPDPETEFSPLDDLSLEAFKHLMEESFEAQRQKSDWRSKRPYRISSSALNDTSACVLLTFELLVARHPQSTR
jgi:hypothetical protein